MTEEEKKWMGKFFADFFFEGSTIYTLFGTKPMSQVTIIDVDEEAWIKSYEPYLIRLEGEKKETLLKKIKEEFASYDLNQNWERWMVWHKGHPNSSFLFSKRPVKETNSLFNAYIINIPQVIWTLEKYYCVFYKELGITFDPIEMVLEFENVNSVFWEKVFDNHFLQGILHGFGERNSYFFSKEFENKMNQSTLLKCIFGSSDLIYNDQEGGDLTHLKLPSFRSYEYPNGIDPVVEKYRKERLTIQKKLKGKNFTNEVINQLFKCNNSTQ